MGSRNISSEGRGFMQIEELMIKIESITDCSEECLAHLSEDGVSKETLKEHTGTSQKYWIQMIKEKNVESIMEEFEKEMFKEMSAEGKRIFESMTWNIVTMHDLGKLNPAFQKDKMKHTWKPELRPDSEIGSKHSMLSAVFYLEYYIKEIKSKAEVIGKPEVKLLREYAYIYSYIISRHHGNLVEFQRYVESFHDEEDFGNIAKKWMKRWKEEIEHEKFTNYKLNWKRLKEQMELNRNAIYLYTWTRLLYSLLVAADYYATSEYMNGVEVKNFGEIADCKKIIEVYENGTVQKKIREQQQNNYPISREKWDEIQDINLLRTEMFLDAEQVLKENGDKTIYYLEAPTGSGKSNTAMNLSFQLIQSHSDANKIFYIYPFNTLVEQNMKCMEKVFGNKKEIMSQIAVVNSLVPLKENNTINAETKETTKKYQEILLDRQFLNYPIILSTHVMLFQTMFGDSKENAFGFHQLCNSVIVLDEIQSYRNNLWNEIITFLKGIAKLLHIRLIIMSATLPNLELLTEKGQEYVNLIRNRDKYFHHKKFAHRVEISYELLDKKITYERLADHIDKNSIGNKKILIEFIKKKSAEEFYTYLKDNTEKPVFLMTGDSSIQERKSIINKVEEMDSVILIATQVIEAGVDIDMDIGYKDVSRLDSEEQFMGRINRSGKKGGKVYFFHLDDALGIYKEDVRAREEKTLLNQAVREILITKDFPQFYEKEILPLLKEEKERLNGENIQDFFKYVVGYLDMPEVSKRMQLIVDNRQLLNVYFARDLEMDDGSIKNGREIWEEYKELLQNEEMSYAEKTVKLYNIRSEMNLFIYQLGSQERLSENEQIGDIYYIEDGESYFDENGVLQKELFSGNEDLFI